MIFLFIMMILTGLGLFLYVFMKELKNVSGSQIFNSVETNEDINDEFIEMKAMCEAATQKASQMEKILSEKNLAIEDMQKKCLKTDEHQSQVETITNLLQNQIDALKQQNKSLKDDLDRAVSENLELQSRLFASDSAKKDDKLNVSAVDDPRLIQDVFNPDNKAN